MMIFQSGSMLQKEAQKEKKLDEGITRLMSYRETSLSNVSDFVGINERFYLADWTMQKNGEYFIFSKKRESEKPEIGKSLRTKFENAEDEKIGALTGGVAKLVAESKLVLSGGANSISIEIVVPEEKLDSHAENVSIQKRIKDEVGKIKENKLVKKLIASGCEIKINVRLEKMDFEGMAKFADEKGKETNWANLQRELVDAKDWENKSLLESEVVAKYKSELRSADKKKFIDALMAIAKENKDTPEKLAVYFPNFGMGGAAKDMYDERRQVKIEISGEKKQPKKLEDVYASLEGKEVALKTTDAPDFVYGKFSYAGGKEPELYFEMKTGEKKNRAGEIKAVYGEMKNIFDYMDSFGKSAEIFWKSDLDEPALKIIRTDPPVLPGFDTKIEKIVCMESYDDSFHIAKKFMLKFEENIENITKKLNKRGSGIKLEKMGGKADNPLNYNEYYEELANEITWYASGKPGKMPDAVKYGYILVIGDMAATDMNPKIAENKDGKKDTRVVSEKTINLMRTALDELYSKKGIKLQMYYFAVAPKIFNGAVDRETRATGNVDVAEHFEQLRRIHKVENFPVVESRFLVGDAEYSMLVCEGDGRGIIWLQDINIDTDEKLGKMMEIYKSWLSRMKQPKSLEEMTKK